MGTALAQVQTSPHESRIQRLCVVDIIFFSKLFCISNFSVIRGGTRTEQMALNVICNIPIPATVTRADRERTAPHTNAAATGLHATQPRASDSSGKVGRRSP